MVWCCNCTKRQPAQSARSILECCNGCGKVVNQETGNKCENELLNNLKTGKRVKFDVAKFKALRTVCKNAKGAVNGKGSNDSKSLSDINDAEIGRYLLTGDETHFKKIIWERMNEQYAKAQADRKAAAENEMKLRKEKQKRQAAEAKETRGTAKTTIKRTSSRVNYDVLKDLLGESTASDKSKKSRTDSYTEDDATSSKYESAHNKFSEWGDIDEDYDEENNVNYEGDRYNDYEEQYYDGNNGGFF